MVGGLVFLLKRSFPSNSPKQGRMSLKLCALAVVLAGVLEPFSMPAALKLTGDGGSGEEGGWSLEQELENLPNLLKNKAEYEDLLQTKTGSSLEGAA